MRAGSNREPKLSARASTVLIVDEDTGFRATLARALTRGGLRVTECGGGEEALAAAAAERPAAVVLETELPDVDGFEVCRELRDAHGEALPVILVSSKRVTPHDRVAGLLIGADDYLVKPVNVDELLVRLRRLLARADSEFARLHTEHHSDLSPRELEVLRLLAGGLDSTQIAERLVISPKTVSSHLHRVLTKLGVHSRAQAVAQAYRLGLAEGAEPGALQPP